MTVPQPDRGRKLNSSPGRIRYTSERAKNGRDRFHVYSFKAVESRVMSVALFRTFFQLLALIGVNGDGWPNGKFKRAIIIGLDGLGGYYLRNTSYHQAPNLWKVMTSPQACYNFLARAEYPLSSAANWAALLTGMTPSETGILTNDWDTSSLHPKVLTDGRVPPVSGEGNLPPTIFKLAKNQNKDIRTALVYSWHWLGKLVDRNVDREFFGGNYDWKTTEYLVQQIKSGSPPDLTFIQFSGIDDAGHSSGWGSKAYYTALAYMDGLVDDILGALLEKSLLDGTLIAITSDHGGYRKGHGDWMRPTTQVPIIFFSPHRDMQEPGDKGWGGWLDIKDVAPTVLGAMGIRTSKYQRGRDFSARF
ncbi:hypothetical protein FOZ63_022561 [Perkinsus olseni]|uniref:Uncharacterized protein n=1 Tax=Perkinsus olseni TaxID=32597 RepID=A0A7J6UKL7_PEROL|nr:hypothetical protein FOZ63_022561 [Perkinsus olseni]